MALLPLVALAGCVASYVPAEQRRAWEPREPLHALDAPEDAADDLRTGAPPRDGAATPRAGLADGLLAFYQDHLRRPEFRGSPGCLFSPSCSVYARESVQSHGVVVGVARTVSRLFFREWTATSESYQAVWEAGHIHLHDPPR